MVNWNNQYDPTLFGDIFRQHVQSARTGIKKRFDSREGENGVHLYIKYVLILNYLKVSWQL